MGTPKLTFVFDRKHVTREDKKRTGVVELRITYNKTRVYMTTGIWLHEKEWSNGKVVGKDGWKELNDQLGIIYKRCSEIVVDMMEAGCLDIKAIPKLFEDRIKQKQTFIEYAKEYSKTKIKNLRQGTQRRYKVVFDFLDSWGGIVRFSDLTEANIQKMDDYLADKGLKESSRYNYHKIVKSFVIQAFNEGLIAKNPYAKLRIGRGEDDGIHRYLTPNEFKRFEKCKIGSEHLAKVRDLFVFQTYTCMGYADLEAFDYKKCEKVKGQIVYRSNRVKTDQPFTVVLLKPALDILKKYGYHLPIISNVKYNDYLKSAVTYAKIDKPVSTHWARHTGATMILNDGSVPMHVVQHILGHASIRETEKTYAKVLDRTIVESMANYQKKKLGKVKKQKVSTLK
jgi:integrase